jgi:hypothetical protein
MTQETNRRREPRYEVASGALTPEHMPGAGAHACLDWSRTGFRIAAAAQGGAAQGAAALPEPGVDFDFELAIAAAMGRIHLRGTARIVRRTPDFAAGTWSLRNPSGPNADLVSLILDAFMEAGPGEI